MSFGTLLTTPVAIHHLSEVGTRVLQLLLELGLLILSRLLQCLLSDGGRRVLSNPVSETQLTLLVVLTARPVASSIVVLMMSLAPFMSNDVGFDFFIAVAFLAKPTRLLFPFG